MCGIKMLVCLVIGVLNYMLNGLEVCLFVQGTIGDNVIPVVPAHFKRSAGRHLRVVLLRNSFLGVVTFSYLILVRLGVVVIAMIGTCPFRFRL